MPHRRTFPAFFLLLLSGISLSSCELFSSGEAQRECSNLILDGKGEQITEDESYHYHNEREAIAGSNGNAWRQCGTLFIKARNGREISMRYQHGPIDQRYEEEGYMYAGYLPESGWHKIIQFKNLDFTYYLIRDSNGKKIEVSSHDLVFSPSGSKLLTFFDHSSLRKYKWEVTIFNPNDPRETYELQLPADKAISWIPDSIRFEDEHTLRMHRKYYDFYTQKYLPDTLIQVVRK